MMKSDNKFFQCSTNVLLLMCLFTVGCSQNVRVTGTVTYSDTGEPVRSGVVFFISDTVMGRANIVDGRYSIGLINDGDGIPRGTYSVVSDSPDIPAPRPTFMMGADGTPIPVTEAAPEGREREVFYTREPFIVEVDRPMTFDFQVERGSRPM